MGSGDWFKTIIGRKKGKGGKAKLLKGSSAPENASESKSKIHNANGTKVANKRNGPVITLSEDVAATRIQTAFRAYMARKALRRMKGILRFQKLTQAQSVKKQAASTLTHLHSWNRIQSQIAERRQSMVIEGRLKQKKLENQMKLEAKLHDLGVEWNGGSETMEEILARIHQREEAAVKRERALAYAFNHQWRANATQNQGSNASELGKANWGWSWKERWIAARPWENRLSSQSISPKKKQNKGTNKTAKGSSPLIAQKSVPVKSGVSNGKIAAKARRLSFPGAEKQADNNANNRALEVAENKRESIS